MIKKRLLFVIESLRAAGGEKSLITLLSSLDYNRVEVDLQLMSFSGEFIQYVPDNVRLLPSLTIMKERGNCNLRSIREFCLRIIYSITIRFVKSNKAKARLYWTIFSRQINNNINYYDVAIGYGQCLPTFYVIDKVEAKLKLGWVNCIFHLNGYERKYQRQYYEKLDKIVLVSEESLNHFKGVYPEFIDKMYMMPDIINPKTIIEMSKSGQSYVDGFTGYRILTVARLNKNDKGYDITLEACRRLKQRGLLFRWYAIGRGEYETEILRFIQMHHLEETFILLGTTPNPYKFMLDADIYVQTSRHEGFGLSIAEARILNIPVVTTEFDAVYSQMHPNKNGIVVPQDPIAVADAIQLLISNKSLYDSIVAYQKQEKKGNLDIIEKFYRLID